VVDRIQEGYGEMPSSYVNIFGWGVAIGLIVVAIILSFVPWPKGVVEREGELLTTGGER